MKYVTYISLPTNNVFYGNLEYSMHGLILCSIMKMLNFVKEALTQETCVGDQHNEKSGSK